MDAIDIEKIIKNSKHNNIVVFDITIMKYYLDMHRILRTEKSINITPLKNIQSCRFCNRDAKVCIRHQSLNRILEAKDKVFLKDSCLGFYFYKNEIFKYVSIKNKDYLLGFHCPHTKTIPEKITKEKIKTIFSYWYEVPTRINFNYEELNFDLTFKGRILKCWFNDDFSIILNPLDKKEIILTPNG